MKATNGEVWQAAQVVGELIDQPWPVKTSYALLKLKRKLLEQARDVEAVRVGLVERHGKADKRGIFKVDRTCEGWPAFEQAWNELVAQETEIDWGPVALPDVPGVVVKGKTIEAMGPFVTEGGASA